MCVGRVAIPKIKKCHFSRIGRVLDEDRQNDRFGHRVGAKSAVQEHVQLSLCGVAFA